MDSETQPLGKLGEPGSSANGISGAVSVLEKAPATSSPAPVEQRTPLDASMLPPIAPRTAHYAPVTPAPADSTLISFVNKNLIALILVGLGVFLLAGQSILLLVGLTLLYLYAQSPQRTGLLIAGSIISGLGAGVILEDLTPSWQGFAAIGLGAGFLAVWLVKRNHWWALIPGLTIALGGFQELLDTSFLTGFWRDWGLTQINLWPIMLVVVGLLLLFSRRSDTPTGQ